MSAAKPPTAITAPLDFLLKPLGFRRKRLTWNRGRDGKIDVLDVQLGKSSTSFTINAGVLLPEVYRVCWGKEPPATIQETDCAVRTRLGDEGRDLWWELDGQSGENPADVVQRVQSRALPFFDGITTLEDAAAALERTLSRSADGPIGRVYLAILKALLGLPEEANRLLDEVAKLPAWKGRVEEVRARLRL